MESISGMIVLIMMVLVSILIGHWEKDRMNGKGLYVSPEGVAAEGIFENDNFVGPIDE